MKAITTMRLAGISAVITMLSYLPYLDGLIDAATTSNLRIISINEDRFYNYDFLSNNNASRTNVDWPVNMIFCHNADVNKVKLIYWGPTILADRMYALMSDNGSTYVWDEDRGTKSVLPHYSPEVGAWVFIHLRVYAPNPPDYLTNSSLGRWVFGTSHYDEYILERWSGYSEYAERNLADIAAGKGYPVYREDWYLYNREVLYNENNHIWLNSGWATRVCVP